MMSMKLLPFVAAITVACSSATTQSGPAHDANMITKDEIATAHATNAYEAVMALRPAMLRYRGKTTITGSDTGYPRVYLDRQLYGDIESLKSLDVGSIRSIHFYNTAEAASRFGLGNASGAIEVVTDAKR
jgi:hypothetical protein